MTRATKLAKGCTWSLTDKQKKLVPLEFKLAATNLAKQFHRVDCNGWEGDRLYIRVFRDADTVNPTTYYIVKRDGVMYRQETGRNRALWPCYPDRDATPPSPTTDRARRRPRRELPVHEVKEDQHDDTVHSMFVTRTEFAEQLRRLELKFIKDPNPTLVLEMDKLRKEMGKVEQQIVLATMTAKLMRGEKVL